MEHILVYGFLVLCYSGSVITAPTTTSVAECTTDPRGDREFFTDDGYRKCSMSCDENTKLFSGELDCTCCYLETNKKDRGLLYKVGFFIILAYGVAATISVIYLKKKRAQKCRRGGVIKQNSLASREITSTFVTVDNLTTYSDRPLLQVTSV